MIGQAETKKLQEWRKNPANEAWISVTRKDDRGECGRFYIIVIISSKVPSISKKIILQSP